jgi:hypothetical protein
MKDVSDRYLMLTLLEQGVQQQRTSTPGKLLARMQS